MTPPVRRLLAAAAVSRTGDALYSITLVVHVYSRTHSPGAVAAAGVIRLLPLLLLSAPAGRLADRAGRRRMLVGCDLVSAVSLALMAVAADAPLAVLLTLAFVGAGSAAARRPASVALTREVAGSAGTATANAGLALIDNAVSIAGPALAGLLLTVASAHAAYGLDAVSFLVSAALVARLPAGPVAARRRARGALRTLAASRDAVAMTACRCAATFVYGVEAVLLVAVADRQLGLGARGIAFLEAAAAVGGLACTRLAARMARTRAPAAVPPALALSGLPLVALAFVHSGGPAIALIVAEGAAIVVLEVCALTTMQTRLPAATLGATAGVADMASAAAVMVGLLVAAPLAGLLGPAAVLAGAGAVLPIVALSVAALSRRRPRPARLVSGAWSLELSSTST